MFWFSLLFLSSISGYFLTNSLRLATGNLKTKESIPFFIFVQNSALRLVIFVIKTRTFTNNENQEPSTQILYRNLNLDVGVREKNEHGTVKSTAEMYEEEVNKIRFDYLGEDASMMVSDVGTDARPSDMEQCIKRIENLIAEIEGEEYVEYEATEEEEDVEDGETDENFKTKIIDMVSNIKELEEELEEEPEEEPQEEPEALEEELEKLEYPEKLKKLRKNFKSLKSSFSSSNSSMSSAVQYLGIIKGQRRSHRTAKISPKRNNVYNGIGV